MQGTTASSSSINLSWTAVSGATSYKVYRIGDFSMEVCGGPHVRSTGELGRFRIVKEQSSSQGVRRIKAVLE